MWPKLTLKSRSHPPECWNYRLGGFYFKHFSPPLQFYSADLFYKFSFGNFFPLHLSPCLHKVSLVWIVYQVYLSSMFKDSKSKLHTLLVGPFVIYFTWLPLNGLSTHSTVLSNLHKAGMQLPHTRSYFQQCSGIHEELLYRTTASEKLK
jgi:hypothetical protein